MHSTDSAYSEKFFGVPNNKDSLHTYDRANLLSSVALLQNKNFMIVLGTSDGECVRRLFAWCLMRALLDNVHMQHSLLLIRKLNELDIGYDVQLYPDDNHYLGKSTVHLYRRMIRFVDSCFAIK